MTMHSALQSERYEDRIYMPRERVARGLISCEGCIRSEEQDFGSYVKNNIFAITNVEMA